MARWIPAFNANYHLGADGIAAPLIMLIKLYYRYYIVS
jgi:NADH-quinone oxidoreductase subunit M